MIYGVISDIHGNIEALEAVLLDFREQFKGSMVCLGDIVGYGANPNECLDLVSRECTFIAGVGIPIVKGNHDEAVHTSLVARFTDTAAEAAIWSNHKMDYESRDFLGSLPYTLEFQSALIVHSSPCKPERYQYLSSGHDIREAFDCFPDDVHVCFVGHTHRPMAWEKGYEGIRCLTGEKLLLEKDQRYLINVGSVGQPRDRDPRASYLVWDIEKKSVLFRRVEYDVESAQMKIIKAGLPESLARRLKSGT